MIGIYKITSPSGKIYIGQSIDIENRWKQYKYFKINKGSIGPKLLNSFKKYGYENHIFEIIEECSVDNLHERETFYKKQIIEKYKWNQVLFCELFDCGGGVKSKETKLKQSKGLQKAYDKGKKKPYWLGKKNLKLTEYNKENSGFKYERTKEHKDELSVMLKKLWEDPIKREQRVKKMSESHKGKIVSTNTKSKMSESHKKPIIQYDKNFNYIKEWDSITEASSKLNTSIGNISAVLNKKQKTAKGFIWKYKEDFL